MGEVGDGAMLTFPPGISVSMPRCLFLCYDKRFIRLSSMLDHNFEFEEIRKVISRSGIVGTVGIRVDRCGGFPWGGSAGKSAIASRGGRFPHCRVGVHPPTNDPDP